MTTHIVNRGSPKRTPQTAVDRYRRANVDCAEIVLREPERYGGAGSLMVLWAELVRDGYKPAPAQDERRSEVLLADEVGGQRELFDQAVEGGARCRHQQ